ncbi:hypothetical protein A946_03080 [Methylacidiphilum kamchatkense Kam1]|uniref:Glycosyltransferase GT-D fold domain-containing protein n=1 Tax=Methylacidiphilum kamchatkense Kam1 TaxID=1202785 RepID=A0A0C1V5M1_9BACT|nr:hypothetical protein [Methylacidiphilum kamchatkense]KIE59035.1 hypothetical protein A946_03080 [Methylacidiphilum kamchatkense Kam1]QDQ43065.1 hypothetical protein kam1_1853 [Methylacidiphilum kamchatkense Kam1]
MMTQDFKKDFFVLLSLFDAKKAFAFSRYNDGEALILSNQKVGCKGEWEYNPKKNLSFRADLRKSLQATDPRFFYGVPSWDTSPEMHQAVLRYIQAPLSQITFAALFANANHDLFLKEFHPRIKNWPYEIFFIGNSKLNPQSIRKVTGAKEILPIYGNCIRFWDKNKKEILAQLDWMATRSDHSLFLIAAGPLGKILIHALWEISPKNTYLDIGSALDPLLFGKDTRAYHKDAQNRSLVLQWAPRGDSN